MTTSAAGLDVIDLTEHAGLNNSLDLLHVYVETGLEADRNDLSAFLFCFADGNGFVKRYAHRLFKQNRNTVLQRVDGTNGVGSVVGANAYCVELFGVEHLKMSVFAFVAGRTVYVIGLLELLSLAGDKVCESDNLNVGLVLIAPDVCFGDPAGTDDTDANLFGSIDRLNFLVRFEFIQDAVLYFCHYFYLQIMKLDVCFNNSTQLYVTILHPIIVEHFVNFCRFSRFFLCEFRTKIKGRA